MRKLLLVLLVAAVLVPVGAIAAGAHGSKHADVHQVTIPEADRFTPFAITIRVGDSVRWVNNDEDAHTVVSDDAFDTTGHQGTDELLAADGGSVTLEFKHPGTFVYYCRFHSHLDSENQPVAPGPDGGIEDPNGNFGTPMMGIVTVSSKKDN